jgi:hypothetical protein
MGNARALGPAQLINWLAFKWQVSPGERATNSLRSVMASDGTFPAIALDYTITLD